LNRPYYENKTKKLYFTSTLFKKLECLFRLEKKNSVALFCRRVRAVFPERFPDVRQDDQVDDEDGGDGGAQLAQKQKYE
jgi:hypothetical protein